MATKRTNSPAKRNCNEHIHGNRAIPQFYATLPLRWRAAATNTDYGNGPNGAAPPTTLMNSSQLVGAPWMGTMVFTSQP